MYVVPVVILGHLTLFPWTRILSTGKLFKEEQIMRLQSPALCSSYFAQNNYNAELDFWGSRVCTS